MQNQHMIEQVRKLLVPFLDGIEAMSADQANRMQSDALNRAVQLRRGVPCGGTALQACLDCRQIGTSIRLCEAGAFNA